MTTEKVYLVHMKQDGFRPGIPGEVIGIKWVDIAEDQKIAGVHHLPQIELSYEVEYSDGTIECVPVKNEEEYSLFNLHDIVNGSIPEITD